jgi:hypothetical protein
MAEIANTEKAPVKSLHPEFDEYVGRWELVKNVVNSNIDEYIKDVEDTRSLTNRMNVPPEYATDEDRKRYTAYYNDCVESCNSRNIRYKDDAQFVNFTARTKAGLVGAIFRKDTVIELPTSIDYLKTDATGSGITMNKLAQEIAGEILMTGRYGLLVDLPATELGITAKTVEDLNLKARIYKYDATSIINWQTQVVNGIPRISLVVLKEVYDAIGEDGFTWESKTQYRVLEIFDGEYWQSIYNAKGEFESEYLARQKDGSSFNEIPFVFVGSEDNDACVDSAPLYDLAKVNIGHLRNSADLEEAIHLCSSPTLIFSTAISQSEMDLAYPGGVKIGARRGYNLGIDGSAQFLEVAPNQLADEAMKRKEEQMRMMGARMTTLGGTNETAEGVRMRLTGETCELTLVAENISDALTQCCQYALMFMGGIDQIKKIKIEVNTDFFEANLDAQLMQTLLLLYKNGVIALKDLRALVRRAGNLAADRTDDVIQLEVDSDEHLSDPLLTNNG